MGNWAELQADILLQIASRLTDSIEDYVALGGVCTSWRSIATKNNFNASSPKRVPWIMLSGEQGSHSREVYSLSKQKNIRQVMLPETAKGNWFESLGWLMNDWDFVLFHPFSGDKIQFPDKVYFEETQSYEYIVPLIIIRMLLSASPSSSSNYSILIIYQGRLGLWRPGADTWTMSKKASAYSYIDVAFHQGEVYTIDLAGNIFICDIRGRKLTVGERVIASLPCGIAKDYYLVESILMEALLVVYVDVDYDSMRIFEFDVFEVDLREGTCKEIRSLGDQVIFLGVDANEFSVLRNGSILVKASSCPGIKANGIYFQHYMPNYNKGVAYYNLENWGIESWNVGGCLKSDPCFPIFITATP